MKWFFMLLSAAAVAAITGCANGARTDAAMQTWVNSNISNLVTSWGPPDSSVLLPDGNIIYTWTDQSVSTLATTTNTTAQVYSSGDVAYGNSQSTTKGGEIYERICQKSFVVSDAGEVLSYNWQGNNCY